MKFPKLYSRAPSREMIQEFRGYNHNLRIGSGEFYDEVNLSADRYPVLAPRKPRGMFEFPEIKDENGELVPVGEVTGMIEKDVLCYTAGTRFYFGNDSVDLDLTEGRKQLISMGAYVIILPDKKYINTADTSDNGKIEVIYKVKEEENSRVSLTLCTKEGENYGARLTQPEAPPEPANGDLWVDTSSTPHALKQWSESTGVWVSIATTYVRIECTNIGKGFKQFDGIEIGGLDGIVKDFETGDEYLDTEDVASINGAAVIWEKGDDYIVVVGLLNREYTAIDVPLKVSRTMPNMDFIIESNNRLWGCRYGTAENGEIVNEIYASKLGDFKNWKCYMGISTDSYAVSLGSDGVFTGAVNHLGYPLFFKERCLHKVYGSMPSQYQMQTTACRGVQQGSESSLAIVNEVLYYKGEHGVCAYDGSLPVEVSSVFGDVHYTEAYAGAHGNKYYASMRNGEDAVLFVYDTAKGVWHKESDEGFRFFCSCRDQMYASNGTEIVSLNGGENISEGAVEWMAETGEIGLSSPDMQNTFRLNINMSMDVGAYVTVYAEYDSSGEWEKLFDISGTNLRPFSMPVRPVRCNQMKLRFEGCGDVRVYSITKTTADGSDIFK